MSIDKTKGLDSANQQNLINEAARVSLSGKKAAPKTLEEILYSNQDSIDKVTVGQGREVLDMLDPQKTAEERKANVERLKQLVQSGQYKGPDSTVLAQSVAGEINVEMMSGAFLQFSDE